MNKLENAINDAKAFGDALKSLNFEVLAKFNLSRSGMIKCLGKAAQDWRFHASEVVIYYSGHGISIGTYASLRLQLILISNPIILCLDGMVHLVPIDAEESSSKMAFKESLLSLERIVGIFLESRETKELPIIAILDCCRTENKAGAIFKGESFQGTSLEFGREANIAILYSTAQGQVAMDGSGQNSPYTKILLESLVKGSTVSEINHEITARLTSSSQQVGYYISSFFFPPST